jgi:HlyD family secretion protein
MKKLRIILFVIGGVAVVAFLVVGLWLSFRPQPVVLEGEVEVTEIDVAAKFPGRVETMVVRLGQTVRQGDLLFTLSSPEVDAKLTQAQSAQAAAAAMHRKAKAGARSQEVHAAWQQFERAQAAAELATVTLQRIERLLTAGVVPQQRRDEVAAQAKAAVAASDAARAMAKMAEEGAREEDKAAAAALEAQAGGAVAEVEAYLAEMRIHAPVEGEVAGLLIDAGEIAPAGYPVITVADLSDLWIVLQVREDLLADVGIGTEFTATVPALGDRDVRLKVDYLAALGAFATWRATSASSGFDLKTFEVRARPVHPVVGLRPGMTVLVPWGTR